MKRRSIVKIKKDKRKCDSEK